MEHNQRKSHFVTGIKLFIILRLIKLHIIWIVFTYLKNWRQAFSTLKTLQGQVRKYRGPKPVKKIISIGGKYYWDMYGVGWPSRVFVNNVKRECRRINASDGVGLRNVLFGITTKCPLQCDHCYEWDNLNLKERLTFNDLHNIITRLKDYGVGQVHFGGGEPMMRHDDIVKLLNINRNQLSFWIVTSGYNVTQQRADELKEVGLTGMCVSLDHHDPEWHNDFRHHKEAFQMAREAVRVANEADLVTALSICATKGFVTEANLMKYAELAKAWNVSYIQLLEPKAAGHYAGQDVTLNSDEKKLLTDFFLRINNDNLYADFPLIIYHEYYKETLGCRGAGNGAIYIDPLGNVLPCPFCRNKVGNLLTDEVSECIEKLQKGGCAMPEIKIPMEVSYQ